MSDGCDGVLKFLRKSESWNSISDCSDVLELIKNCEKLESLTISGVSIGIECAKELGIILGNKKLLKDLYISDIFTGRVKDELIIAIPYIFEGILKSGAKIETLEMSDNALGPYGMRAMSDFFSNSCHLKSLHLNNNGLGSVGAQILVESILNCVKTHDNVVFELTELQCGRNRLEDKGALYISQIIQKTNSLKKLSIPQNGINHKGVKYLSQALGSQKNLRFLDLNDNIVTEKGCKELKSLIVQSENLYHIDIGDCLIRDSGATRLNKSFAKSKSQIQFINFGFNELSLSVAKDLLNVLAKYDHDVEIILNGNIFGSAGKSEIEQFALKHGNIKIDSMEDNESESSSESQENEDRPSFDSSSAGKEKSSSTSRDEDSLVKNMQNLRL